MCVIVNDQDVRVAFPPLAGVHKAVHNVTDLIRGDRGRTGPRLQPDRVQRAVHEVRPDSNADRVRSVGHRLVFALVSAEGVTERAV
jgi:hypothetical protein